MPPGSGPKNLFNVPDFSLDLAGHFLRAAFVLEVLIFGQAPGGFFRFPGGFPGGAFHVIFKTIFHASASQAAARFQLGLSLIYHPLEQWLDGMACFSDDSVPMEAPEVPIEHLQEEMEHHAHAGAGRKNWVMWVALSSAILAGLAAVAALLAGHHSNEAMIEQIKASDQWSYYQAKGVKANVLASKMELLQVFGKTTEEKDIRKAADYKKEQEEISREAREKEHEAKHHLKSHVIFARAVTLFQVAIAVGAIAVLAHRRRYWVVSMFFGAGGAVFLVQGLLFSMQSQPPHLAVTPATQHAPTVSR